jgi:hypothetical protein
MGNQTTIESHRLGNHFEAVQLLPESVPASTSFRLLFHRRPTAPRFWKDYMVRVAGRIRDQAAVNKWTLEYRGDEEPKVLEATE